MPLYKLEEQRAERDAEIARLRAERDALREALEWYAKAVVSTIHPDSPGHCDDGGYARSTLRRSAT